jgi:predicted ester cyclase
MNQLKRNKELIMEYISTVSGRVKPRAMLERYNADPGLVDTILFMDQAVPAYEVFVDEILAEGNRVMVRARLKGKHAGELLGFPPTNKDIELPYVVGYEIYNKKIVHSWLIADNLILLEQIKGKEALI